MRKVRENARRPAVLGGATGFVGARVCRAEAGIMWAGEACRLAAGTGLVTGGQESVAPPLGAGVVAGKPSSSIRWVALTAARTRSRSDFWCARAAFAGGQVPRERASRVRRLWVAVLAKIDLRWSWTVCSDTNMCWVMSRVAAPVTR